MRNQRLQRSRAPLASVIFLCVAASCTSTVGEPDDSLAGDVARSFVSAFNERDFETLSSLSVGSAVDADDLRRQIGRILRSAAATSIEIALTDTEPTAISSPSLSDTTRGPVVATGAVPSPTESGTESEVLPYELKVESSATRRPVTLAGYLELRFDDGTEAWRVAWDRRLLYAGVPDAVGYRVSSRWLKRGSILDRDGRKLATGAVESRRYPFGSLAGTTIGHIGPATKKEAAALGVAPGDLVGASGLEEGLQERLAGRPVTSLALVDRRGEVVETLGRRDGRRGRNVKTTLDMEIQRATRAAYGSTTGGAVVMDPLNGDLLAIVSSSPFDPNGYVGVGGVEPFDRATRGLYPPGSAMKVVTAAAALDTGTVTPATQLSGPAEYQGVRNFESGEFGSLTFATAVQYSVNTAFAQVAIKLGPKRITRYADAFGFNRVPEVPIDAAESSFPFPDDQGDLMWGSIGQAQVLATPLQMASVAATVANGGKRMEPRILKRDPRRGEQVMSRRTARTLTELMTNVVVGGTGQAARLAGIDVAGKTGTAEVDVGGERKNHAWFICFAPAGEPDMAVAVVSEYGGIGGQVAAPIARQIMASNLLIIQADDFRAGRD
ncbi:MAG: penicillin-binding transpeptidase domain-containing protein [Actinomycetota bacterium]|nr:penicillin-binding transpeptidase domain-containing protein [Actinomycetota bacterium]